MKLSIIKKEFFYIPLISIMLVATTMIPYATTWFNTSEKQQTWIGNSSPSDTYTYLAWIEQAKQGKWLFKALYSSEIQPDVFFHPVFVTIGFIGRLVPLSNIALYHGARLLTGFLLLLCMYIFISYFTDNREIRFITWLMATIGSGIGALVGYKSADTWMTEINVYFSLSQTLLNNVSLLLILTIFLLVLRYFEHENRAKAILIGLLTLLLSLIHAYYIGIVLIVITAYTIYAYWRTKKNSPILNWSYVMILALIGVLIIAFMLYSNPILGTWAFIQTSVPTPKPFYLLSGLGLIGVFAIFEIIRNKLQLENKKQTLLIIWVLTCLILAFFPGLVRYQRKFTEGLQFALSLLAGSWLVWSVTIIHHRTKISKKILYVFVFLALCSTNLLLIYTDIKKTQHASFPQFVSVNKWQALEWINVNIPKTKILASGYGLGNLIPGVTGNTVYLGHYDQTLNSTLKYEVLNLTIISLPYHTDPLRSFVKLHNIAYIIEDDELGLWGISEVVKRDYLQLVYENQEVKIFKVNL